MRTIALITAMALTCAAAPSFACEYDDSPEGSYYGIDGISAAAAELIAQHRKQAIIEHARQTMLQRLGIKDAEEPASPALVTLADAQP